MSAPSDDLPPFFAILHERIRGKPSPQVRSWHFNFAAAWTVLCHPLKAYRCVRWLKRTTTSQHLRSLAAAHERRRRL